MKKDDVRKILKLDKAVDIDKVEIKQEKGINYPNNKHYDKYSFSTSNTSRIRSKLGDGIKEVYKGSTGWYSDSSNLAYSNDPWFLRGGYYHSGSSTGVFLSDSYNGKGTSFGSSRLVITP